MVGAFMKSSTGEASKPDQKSPETLKQGCKAKDLPCACFCPPPLAADEDSRLNLERLGSTSLLQLLPELVGTLTEDSKAGEELPQQWEGAHGSHLQLPQISHPSSQVFAKIQHYM